MTKTKSLNSYSHHAPKIEWINQFFEYKDEFDQRNSLGSQMFSFFKRFLRDAELLDNNKFSDFANLIYNIGLEDNRAWALLLTNLSYTPQIGWLVNHIPFDDRVSKEYVTNLLIEDGAKEQWVGDIWSSLSRLMDLPFSEVGLGTMQKEKKRSISLYVIHGQHLYQKLFYTHCIDLPKLAVTIIVLHFPISLTRM